MMRNKYLIIIPAYNEEEEIEAVLEDINMLEIDFIVVDDGSTDSTNRIAQRYCEVLENKSNQGKGAAVKKGVAYAKENGYTHVIMFDSDGEKDSKDILKFVSLFEKRNDVDIIFGIRALHRSVLRKFLNSFTRFWINQAVGVKIYDPLCGFVGVRVDSVVNMGLKSDGFEIETEIALEAGKNRLNYYEISVRSPKFTQSKLNFSDMVEMNVFYDNWVLANLDYLDLVYIKRVFLHSSCVIGRFIASFFR